MGDEELFETQRRLLQHFYETEEQSFVRNLAYCLLTRQSAPRAREAVRRSLWALRVKRALSLSTPEELAKRGIEAKGENALEGWTTRLDQYDREAMLRGREWLRFWFSPPG